MNLLMPSVLATSTSWPFMVLAVGIIFIVVAIAVFRFHAFVALILAAILVGVLAETLPGAADQNHIVAAIELSMTEFGITAGKIAWVIGVAAIIGVCLMESGAADKIVRSLVRVMGEKKAGWAMMFAAFFLSIPVFFDTVFFLIIPLAQALAFRLGKRYLYFVMCVCAGGALTHGLVPPTPGPLVMIETLQLDLGFAMIMGTLLGLPAGAFGVWLASRMDKKLNLSLRESPMVKIADLESIVSKDDSDLPPFVVSILPVVLPVFLIALASIVKAFGSGEVSTLNTTIEVLGNKNLAMAIGTLIAIYLMASQRKINMGHLWKEMEAPIATAGTIILITSAGGAFGAMIRHAGVGEAVQAATEGTGLSLLLLAWLIAAVMKVAQGSGTVSMITTSGIMAAIIGVGGGGEMMVLPYHPVYIFAVIAFGSQVGSWMNDSGFWVVCKLSGFTEGETLKTWSIMLASLGLFGLLEVMIISKIIPLIGG
ncbi:MAG: SLC13 family permease [Verrucomicrobia bacterium]|nr:SLC13 family permease [Verrucomicrobiota bacterium]MDA1069676.1 SLC13 family permease [Verrucomicrobiota bacterium]